jgi:hypothetical protein
MRKSIKDDEIYGPIRAEICDAYIVAGKPKPEWNWLYGRLVEVTLENQELEIDRMQICPNGLFRGVIRHFLGR